MLLCPAIKLLCLIHNFIRLHSVKWQCCKFLLESHPGFLTIIALSPGPDSLLHITLLHLNNLKLMTSLKKRLVLKEYN